MSELLEKFRTLKHLPLFPLPLVLLPNELLPLHIFEPRYRQMLKDLESGQQYFGVSLFEPNPGVDKPPTGTTGCIAEVRESHPLPDGASNILTMGIIRYRLIDYIDAGEPYLVGDLEFFEDVEEDDADELTALAENVHTLFKRVAKAAFQLSGSRGRLPDIPKSSPQELSFLIATAFNLDNELKYQMLETDSTSERLNRLNEILLHTVDKMEDSASIQKVAQTNGHGQKKIDL